MNATRHVFGVGWPRTGTTTLKHALERLGFGPCAHATTLMQDLDQVALWEGVERGEAAAIDTLLDRYRSFVDNPAVCFWRTFAAACPDARFVLTVRDPRDWHASYLEAIHPHTFEAPPPAEPRVARFVELLRRVWIDEALGGHPRDVEACVARFEAHAREVRDELGDRVLRFRPEQGWEPLCSFLGVPVPHAPFPHRNARSTLRALGHHEV